MIGAPLSSLADAPVVGASTLANLEDWTNPGTGLLFFFLRVP
jgi:hypothetical protein